MDLKELMGDAYKEGITAEEVQAFFKNQMLSTGKYVNKEMADAEQRKLQKEVDDYKIQLDDYKTQLGSKMTDDEKKQVADEDTKKLIEQLQRQLAESNLTISKKTALSSLSGIKSKAGIKDDDKEFDDFIANIAFEDNSKTDKISQYISKIVTSAYESGKNDATKEKLAKMGSFKGGQDTEGSEERGAFGKQLAQTMKTETTVKKDFFERK